MRRAACIAALVFILGTFARADQGWQDNQDGNNFACFDAASFAANNLNLSGGTYSTYASGLVVNSNPNASVTAWFVDPVSGNDSNNGTTSGTALKTFKEWSRRVRGATGVATTVTLMNDDADSDTIDVSCDGGVTIQGSETVVSTQTVTASQGRLAASNLANEITVSAFTWSPFLNTMLRVQGTQNYAAITKIVSTSVARLGELWNTSSSTQASSTGVANGAVVELVHTTKGPLQMIVTGRASPTVIDIAFDGSGPVHYSNTRVSRDGGFDGLQRVIFGGTTSTVNTGAGLLMIGGIVKSSTSFGVTEGNLLTQGTAYDCLATTFQTSNLVKMRSAVMQDTTVTLAPANMELNGDFGQFDLPAASAGIALNQFGVGSTVIFTSGSHYGGGNDPSSWVWSIGQQTQVIYGASAPPAMNAGLGVQINGGNVALGSLPVPISPFTGSGAIDSTAVAGCLQTDGSGNVSSTGTACGSGSGGVSSATGTAQRISVAPTTGAVVVDTIGGYYSGAVSSGNEDLGTTLTNGLVCDTTTAGVAVLRTCSSGTDYQPPTAKTCSAGQFVDEIDATGAVTCAAPGSAAFYQTWTDGTFTPLPQETFSTAGAGLSIADDPSDNATVVSLPAVGSAGSCTNCSLTFDLFGRETARASGTAPVTTVTGTSGQILCTPTSPNPVCSLVATGVTGTTCTNCSLGYDTLGRLTSASSGTAPVTGIGVTAPITTTGGSTPTIGITGGANQVQVGTGSNIGGFNDFVYSDSTHQLSVGEPLASIGSTAQAQFYRSTNGQADFVVANDNSGTSAQVAIRLSRDTPPTTTDSLLFGLLGTNFLSCAGGGILNCKGALFELEDSGNFGFSDFGVGDIIFATTSSRTSRMIIKNGGLVQFPAGYLQPTAVGVPGAAPSGTGYIYVDSTSKNLAIDNDAGIVNHGAQTLASTAGVCASGLANDGSWTTQSFTVPGTAVTCTQLPALTGDITKAAGSCATVDTNKGKVYTDATDAAANAPHYLYPGLTSFTNTISFSPIGSGDGQVTIDVVPGSIAIARHDYFVNTQSLQPADTTLRYAATSQSLMDYSGVGAIEYPNDFKAGHVGYKFRIIQSVGIASSMDCWVTLNGSVISATDLNFTPGITAPGVYTVATVATGSTSVSDTFGFACTYNGSFTLGPFGAQIAFAVQEVLTP